MYAVPLAVTVPQTYAIAKDGNADYIDVASGETMAAPNTQTNSSATSGQKPAPRSGGRISRHASNRKPSVYLGFDAEARAAGSKADIDI